MDDERIIEIERMHSAVLLARGTFHQFGNLLTLVGGYASLVRSNMLAGSEDEELMIRIDEAVKQASSLLDDTHRFIRGKPVEAEALDVRRTIADVAELLGRTFPRLEVRTSLPAEKTLIQASARRLFDALMHLCLNAFEAMDRNGAIHIEAATEGPTVLITVSDEGPGIPEEAMEAGFTTGSPDGLFKTGLGLPAVRAFAGSIDGTVELGSGPEGGGLVKIALPALNP
jgi:signal transduction histidine kinase